MVRARPVARKSFAHRRVRRIKKYDHHVVPKRFKVWLPDMSDLLKAKLEAHVECETPTMTELERLGVPESEWRYYLGYMKRMLLLYLSFSEETLEKEKQSLIEEYVLRGKDRNVLEQIQEVAAECAGIEVIEGDFSAWSLIWDIPFPDGLNSLLFVDATASKDYLYVTYLDGAPNSRLLIVKISDGSQVFLSPAATDYLASVGAISEYRNFMYNTLVYVLNGGKSFSILAKYVLLLRLDLITLEVWKDGVLQWSSPDPSTIIAGATDWRNGFIRFDGKYVFAVTDNSRIACFEGA